MFDRGCQQTIIEMVLESADSSTNLAKTGVWVKARIHTPIYLKDWHYLESSDSELKTADSNTIYEIRLTVFSRCVQQGFLGTLV